MPPENLDDPTREKTNPHESENSEGIAVINFEISNIREFLDGIDEEKKTSELFTRIIEDLNAKKGRVIINISHKQSIEDFGYYMRDALVSALNSFFSELAEWVNADDQNQLFINIEDNYPHTLFNRFREVLTRHQNSLMVVNMVNTGFIKDSMDLGNGRIA